MEPISSRGNPIVKDFRAAARPGTDLLLLDGVHLLEDALAAGVTVEVVAVSAGLADGPAGDPARRAEAGGARLVMVSEQVLCAISPVRTPSGVVALARRPAVSLESGLNSPPQLVLMLADVQDPGNVGAIVRAGEACGATGIVSGEGTADPFGWKALRGSMGSAFRIPVVTRIPLQRAVTAARERGIQIFAAVPRDGTPLPRCDLRGPIAILLGSEGAGLSPDLLTAASGRLSIPMSERVESLNVATAAALVAYEAMRQRQGVAP